MLVNILMKGLTALGEYPKLARFLAKSSILARFGNWIILEFYTNATAARPRPFSMVADYTTWTSLTDRSYTGRHLPIDPMPRDLPSVEDVAQLWRRKDGQEIPSKDTSILLGYFAQWFTDSFLRTNLEDRRKNTSNHEIDLCQLYGLNAQVTDLLRLKKGGKLRYQIIDDAIYPPYLFSQSATIDMLQNCSDASEADNLFDTRTEVDSGLPNFFNLHGLQKLKFLYRDCTNEDLQNAFVTGLEHGNSSIGYTAVNTIFLREHNRLCDVFMAECKDNGMSPNDLDDFIFEKVRNTMIGILLKIVICDYVTQIAGLTKYGFNLSLDPNIGEGQPWKRSNWISLEFDLLYRWHSLIPDQLEIDASGYPFEKLRNNPKLLLKHGVENVLHAASRQKAGQIGLQNTHEIFFQPIPFVAADVAKKSSIQDRTVKMARDAKLQPFNAYRQAFGLRPIKSFEELTDDKELQTKLRALYKDIDNLEWFAGIFAEKPKSGALLGELMTTMVAYDAFTHALSNPLMSPNIFNDETFTSKGMTTIMETSTFAQLFNRNSVKGAEMKTAFNTYEAGQVA